MASDLDITNMALLMLGDDPLTATQFTANTARRSVVAQQFLPTCRDQFVKSFPWNIATVRAQWTADAGITPAWGYQYQYTVPALCLRVLLVDEDPDFVREANHILADDSTIDVLYLEQIRDYNLFNAEQAYALATLLAATIAEPLTGKADRTTGLMQLYMERLRIAQGVDGQEGTPPTTYSSSLVENR